MPKPFVEGQVGNTPLKGAEKGAMAKNLPELMGWLCDATYSDGAPMGASQLQLRRQGGMILATLKIEDQGGLCMQAADSSPERALASLEALLAATQPPWQTDRFPLGGGSKKKR